MAVRINGNALDTDKRTDSKYLLTLDIVNRALNMNGVNTYFGLEANVYLKLRMKIHDFKFTKFEKLVKKKKLTRIC